MLTRFAMAATPPNSVVGGEINDTGAVAQVIAQLFGELQSKRKLVSGGLWGSSIIIKKITIPRMDQKVIGEQIRWEAEQYIPFDINEVNLAYKILQNTPQNNETMDILIIAARQEQAFKYAEAIELAGLECSILDVGGFALANCFEYNYGAPKAQIASILNVGANSTSVVIIDNGEIVFCRDISVGGATYTAEIQKGLSVSAEEAESMKLSACTGQAAPEEVLQIIRTTHDLVCDEIQASFDFFINTNANAEIKSCYVSGGGSRAMGLLEHASQKMKMKFQKLDPFVNVKYNPVTFPAEYIADIRDFAAVSIGLGLRKPGDG